MSCLVLNVACFLTTGCQRRKKPKCTIKKLSAIVSLSPRWMAASKLNSINPNKRCSLLAKSCLFVDIGFFVI